MELTSEQAERVITEFFKALTHIADLVDEAATRPKTLWTVGSAAMVGEACGLAARTALDKLEDILEEEDHEKTK